MIFNLISDWTLYLRVLKEDSTEYNIILSPCTTASIIIQYVIISGGVLFFFLGFVRTATAGRSTNANRACASAVKCSAPKSCARPSPRRVRPTWSCEPCRVRVARAVYRVSSTPCYNNYITIVITMSYSDSRSYAIFTQRSVRWSVFFRPINLHEKKINKNSLFRMEFIVNNCTHYYTRIMFMHRCTFAISRNTFDETWACAARFQ